MNKFSVVITINGYLPSYVPPSTLDFSVKGVQYNTTTATYSTTVGTQLCAFDYIQNPAFPIDIYNFSVADAAQTTVSALDLMFLMGTDTPFYIGKYRLYATFYKQAGIYKPTYVYNIKWIFAAYDVGITNMTFTSTISNPSPNISPDAPWTSPFSAISKSDLGIAGLTYAAALQKIPPVNILRSETFKTSFTGQYSEDQYSQPTQINTTIKSQGIVYSPTNFMSVNLETLLRGITEPNNNLPYQKQTMTGGGIVQGATFQVALLTNATGFTSERLPDPIPEPIMPIADEIEDNSGLDDQVGISEQQLFDIIDNDDDMTPGTRALARQRLYIQSVQEAYDKKGFETLLESRDLMGLPLDGNHFDTSTNSLAGSEVSKILHPPQVSYSEQDFAQTSPTLTNSEQQVISQYLLPVETQVAIRDQDLQNHMGHTVPSAQEQQDMLDAQRIAKTPFLREIEKNQIPIIQPEVDPTKWSFGDIGKAAAAAAAAAYGAKQIYNYITSETIPVVGNSMPAMSLLQSTHLKELWEQEKKDKDYEHYNESKIRDKNKGPKRRKLFNLNQL